MFFHLWAPTAAGEAFNPHRFGSTLNPQLRLFAWIWQAKQRLPPQRKLLKVKLCNN